MIHLATTPWRQSACTPDEWRTQYGLRQTTEAERAELVSRYTPPYAYVVCFRRETRHHDGTCEADLWERWAYGHSPAEAVADVIGDTAYQRAESFHQLHRDAVADLARRNDTAARRRTLERELAELGIDPTDTVGRTPLDREAQSRYHAALKKARLYSAASRGEAPPERVAAIKAECRAWYQAELESRSARATELRAEVGGLACSSRN